MELITADDVGEILIYECPECGHQEEIRVESEEDELDDPRFSGGSDPGENNHDLEGDRPETDQEE